MDYIKIEGSVGLPSNVPPVYCLMYFRLAEYPT